MLCPSCMVTVCDKEKNLMGFLSVHHLRTANSPFGMFCGWAAKEGCVIAPFPSFTCSLNPVQKQGRKLIRPWRAELQPCHPTGTTARAGHSGQQGYRLQQKPEWKFPEKRRDMSTSWIQALEMRKKENF